MASKFFLTTASPFLPYVFFTAFLIAVIASSFGMILEIAKKHVCKIELIREPIPVSLATLDALIT